MIQFSACIEMLFVKEAARLEERLQHVRAAGLTHFEFWQWMQRDIGAIRTAMDNTGLFLTALVAEPMVSITDAGNHAAFVEGLKRSIEVAQMLGAPVLIAQAGDELSHQPRTRQHSALVEGLALSADVLRGSGVRLALEPLNTRVDHPGYYLSATAEGLDIIDEVARNEIGLLLDLYHAMVMEEDVEQVVAGRENRIIHVHVADHPGRNEPGSGTLPLRRTLHWLIDRGYDGPVGLEFRPTGESAAAIRTAVQELQQ
jgi:hydroxypyruvate isomerase